MDDQWPKQKPEIKNTFKKAHDGKSDEATKSSESEIVTKKQIENLEKEQKKPTRGMHLVPRGMGSSTSNSLDKEKERAARIEKMKQRLKQNEGKARNDFNKTIERDQKWTPELGPECRRF